jgi:hypothetical protein
MTCTAPADRQDRKHARDHGGHSGRAQHLDRFGRLSIGARKDRTGRSRSSVASSPGSSSSGIARARDSRQVDLVPPAEVDQLRAAAL